MKLQRSDREILVRCRIPQVLSEMQLSHDETRRLHRLWIRRLIGWTWQGVGKRFCQTTEEGLAALTAPPPPGRSVCINLSCGRTFPMRHEGESVICNGCFKLVPALHREYKLLWSERRSLQRRRAPDQIELDINAHKLRINWHKVEEAFRPNEKPEGIEAFFEEWGFNLGG